MSSLFGEEKSHPHAVLPPVPAFVPSPRATRFHQLHRKGDGEALLWPEDGPARSRHQWSLNPTKGILVDTLAICVRSARGPPGARALAPSGWRQGCLS